MQLRGGFPPGHGFQPDLLGSLNVWISAKTGSPGSRTALAGGREPFPGTGFSPAASSTVRLARFPTPNPDSSRIPALRDISKGSHLLFTTNRKPGSGLQEPPSSTFGGFSREGPGSNRLRPSPRDRSALGGPCREAPALNPLGAEAPRLPERSTCQVRPRRGSRSVRGRPDLPGLAPGYFVAQPPEIGNTCPTKQSAARLHRYAANSASSRAETSRPRGTSRSRPSLKREFDGGARGFAVGRSKPAVTVGGPGSPHEPFPSPPGGRRKRCPSSPSGSSRATGRSDS